MKPTGTSCTAPCSIAFFILFLFSNFLLMFSCYFFSHLPSCLPLLWFSFPTTQAATVTTRKPDTGVPLYTTLASITLASPADAPPAVFTTCGFLHHHTGWNQHSLFAKQMSKPTVRTEKSFKINISTATPNRLHLSPTWRGLVSLSKGRTHDIVWF